MEEKIKEIMEKHYSEILSELEEIIDTEELEITFEIMKHGDFNLRLG